MTNPCTLTGHIAGRTLQLTQTTHICNFLLVCLALDKWQNHTGFTFT